MSRKYISQVDNQNFVFPNNQVSEYDVDIIHNVNDNCVSGSVINFTVTGRTSTGMTINFDYIWDLNGATPFIRNSGAVSVLSLHMMGPTQNYYKPFLCVGRFVFNNIPITRIESGVTPGFDRLSFFVTPSMIGLTSFTDGTYYFEIKFIGERCVFPVCFSQLLTTPTPTPTPTVTSTPTATPTATPTPTPSPTPCTTPSLSNKTVSISNGGSFSLSPTNTPPDTVPAGTTYTWTYVDNPNITGEANQPVPQSSITGGPLTNSAGTTQSVVYTVTPYNGSCTGSTFTVTVSVLAGVTPTPTPTSTPTPTPTSTPTPTPTVGPACVTSASFDVDSAGTVTYINCCGDPITNFFGIGPQVINACMENNSVFGSGAVISNITYNSTSCSCVTPTPTPTATSTPTPTPTETPLDCLCYCYTYTTVPSDLSVRYRNCSTDTTLTTLINSLETMDNGDGTYTACICVKQGGAYAIPVCVQGGIEVTCPDVWVSGSSCDGLAGPCFLG